MGLGLTHHQHINEQELRTVLESMAGLIGCKVWYVTEKGELEVRRIR